MTCWEEVPNREEHHTKNTPISSKVGREHREKPGIRQVRMDPDRATQALHFSHTPYTHTHWHASSFPKERSGFSPWFTETS